MENVIDYNLEDEIQEEKMAGFEFRQKVGDRVIIDELEGTVTACERIEGRPTVTITLDNGAVKVIDYDYISWIEFS